MKLATIIGVILISALTALMASALPLVRLGVLVVDETGTPVADATVSVVYPGRISGQGTSSINKTDKEGRASFAGNSFFSLPVKIEKAGYYSSRQDVITYELIDGKNIYTDQNITMTLRPIISPTAMYAYRFDAVLNVVAEPRGFDLIVNDWVYPWGQGASADMVFHVTGYFNRHHDNDSTLFVTFTNPHDGMMAFGAHPQSELKSPYNAPRDGYVAQYKWRKSVIPLVEESKEYARQRWQTIDETISTNSYMFRIRSVVDQDGELVSAVYGKIYGQFNFAGASKDGTFIRGFEVYVNPTPNDRNLEFDPKQNLMRGLNVYDQPKKR